jgi:O-antigen/teichoic acid export membrane protein
VWLSSRIGAASLLVAAVAGGTSVHLLGEHGFAMPQLSRVSVVVAAWIVLLAVGQMIAELFRGLHHLFAASVLGGVTGGLASNILFLALLTAAAARGSVSFETAVTLVIPASFAVVVLSAICLYLFAWPRTSTNEDNTGHDLPNLSLRQVLGDAWPIALVQAVSFGVAQLDIWTVARFGGEADLAVYAIARRVSLLVALPLTLVSLAIASSISELHARRDRQRLSRVIRGAANVSTVTTLLLIAGMMFGAEWILATGFGAAYHAGAGALRILCVGQLVYVLSGPSGVTLMMTGHQQIPLRITLATLPLYGLGPWVVVRYGGAGMAFVSASYLVLNNLLQWIAVRRSLGIRTHATLAWIPRTRFV